MSKLVPGKLYKFQYVSHHNYHLEGKLVMYLGEDHIHRKDGVVVKNFRVQMVGAERPGICDNGMRYYLKELSSDEYSK